MFKFHAEREKYFEIQYSVTKHFIIPFLVDYIDFNARLKVLEVGCGEGGVLKAFAENGHQCTGMDSDQHRLQFAEKFMKNDYPSVQFILGDFINIDVSDVVGKGYDLIIVKDVIEHISEQQLFVKKLKDVLNSGGKIFFAFPPWQMPFGGHQQICSNRLLSLLPYVHLLPFYKYLLVLFREKDHTIVELEKLRETGISIERFEKIIRTTSLVINSRILYLFNPIYKYKFGISARQQFSFITSMPGLRNYFTSCAYYLIG